VPTEAYVTPSQETVATFLQGWLGSVGSIVRPTTLAYYRMIVDCHLVPRIGGVPLQALTAGQINALYGTLLREGRRDGRGGLSRKSVRNVHMVLRRALADAVRWDRLVRNPADLADPPPARRGDAPTMKTWTAAELRRFLAHVEGERLYGAWVVAATTGMRRGEVLALRWRDVDLTLGRLSISQQVTTLGNRPVVSSPKTAKSRRLVALDPATVEALRGHRIAQAQERLLMGPAYRDEDLVFAWPDGRPIHPDLFSQWFDRRLQAAGLPRIRLHDLRHTHATLALAAGIHPKVVSERLGHSTISITLDTYSHVSPGLQEEAAARVADLVFGQ
jgi:integrase